jgi:hypothetical protein
MSFTSSSSEALTASARKIDYASTEEKARYRKRQKGWQDEAWRYYDECPEIWYGANFVANCLRKIRLVPATQPDVSQPPTPIYDPAGVVNEQGPGNDSDEITPPPPTEIEMEAIDLVKRLGRADGGVGGLMAGFGLNLSIPGECVLVAADDELGNEHWAVYSTDQVFVNSQGVWAIRTAAGDKKGTPLPDNSVAYRFWRPHPRWSETADSPMRPLLDVVEELMILSRTIRATGRSRLAGAGMLLWPAEANLGSATPSTDPTVSGQAVDPVLADMMQAMMTPIGDEGVAAAVVPLLMRVPDQYIKSIQHLHFDRPIDPEMAKQRDELRRRIATGLDIPAQVILGLEDLNHWNAWMVDEQTFKAHLEPLVVQICGSLTSAYLRPLLGINDELDSDLLVWYDATALIGHPNREQSAKDAFDRYLISEDAGRRYLGFSDEDEPSDQEVQERVARKSIERLGPLRTGEVLGETTEVSGAETVEPGIPATGPDAGQAPTPVTASAGRRTARSGWKLAHRDRDMRTRLTTAADAAVFRALERAGATLRRHTSKDATVKSILTDVPNHQVASVLGAEAVLSFGVDTEQMLADSFDSLSMQFDRIVQRAQQDVRDMIDELDDDDEIDMDAVAAQQGEDRREAAALLVAALAALATARIFDPHPEAAPLGEHDTELLVPPGYLREALAVAGGSPAPSALDGTVDAATGGIFTGDLISSVWNKLGVGPRGYEWFVGAPARPFEPHQDLDGVQFETFSDDVLAADGGEFPFVDFYRPGDHLGCQCDFAPILAEE